MDDLKLMLEIEGKNNASRSVDEVVASLAQLDAKGAAAALGVAGGMAAIGVAIAAVAVKAYELGSAFDDAFDRIQVGTGATGDKLDVLKADFNALVGGVPASFDQISAAITGLNQRTGQTGDGLQLLAKNVLELSRLTRTDLNDNIRTSTRLFGDWSIAVGDQSRTLDKVFRAYQQTGTGVDKLMQLMVQFGAPLRQLNFGFDESLALLGKWDREGVNLELVMGSLRMGIGEMARAGVPLRDGLDAITKAIRDTDDESMALALAMEVFGARAGPDMAAAIREGRFELGGLTEDIADGETSILETAAATQDAAEKWQMALGEVAKAFAPVGAATLELATSVVEQLTPSIQFLADPVLPAFGAALGVVGAALGAVGGAIDSVIAKAAIMAQSLAGMEIPAALSMSEQRLQTSLATAQNTTLPGDRSHGFSFGVDTEGNALAASAAVETVEAVTEAAIPPAKTGGQSAADAWVEAMMNRLRNSRTGGGGGGGRGGGGGGGGGIKAAARTALMGFDDAVAEWARDESYITAFGDAGAKMATALAKAAAENTEASGREVQRAHRDLVALLERSGVPEWQHLAEISQGAWRAVMEKRDQASINAGMDWLGEIVEQLKAAGFFFGGLTADNFIAGFRRAALDEQFGREGAAIFDALEQATKEGSERNVRALSDAAFRMVRHLYDEVPPETAGAWGDQVMDAILTLIRERTPEARHAVEELFTAISFQTPLVKLGQDVADRINVATDEAIAQIGEIQRNTQSQIDDAVDSLAESRATRGRREGLAGQQQTELDDAIAGVNRQKQAYQDLRSEQAAARQEKREDDDRDRRRADEDVERVLSRERQLTETRRHNQPRGQGPAAGAFVTTAAESPIDDLRKQFAEEDKETARLRGKEDAETVRRRAEAKTDRAQARIDRDEDAEYFKGLDAGVELIKQRHIGETRTLEDTLADEALQKIIGPGGRLERERDAAIGKVQERLDETTRVENQRYTDLETKQETLNTLTDKWFQGARGDLEWILENLPDSADSDKEHTTPKTPIGTERDSGDDNLLNFTTTAGPRLRGEDQPAFDWPRRYQEPPATLPPAPATPETPAKRATGQDERPTTLITITVNGNVVGQDGIRQLAREIGQIVSGNVEIVAMAGSTS